MQIYALLVGINKYRDNVGKLTGSLNDVGHYEDFLKAHFPKDKLNIQKLLDSDATHENIVQAFRDFLCRAGQDDIALFQYSGHGARWNAAPEFKRWFPDGMDEGLICYDSRSTSDAYDLADKELAILLSEVAANKPDLAVILDCCHSGSGTRSAADLNQMRARSTYTVKHPRPLESYLDQYYFKKKKANESLLPPASRHMLMASCTRYGVAYEYQSRGVFSRTLLEAIDRVGMDVSYGELFRRVRSLVRRHKTYDQTPQFEAVLGFNANQKFLSRLTSVGRRRFSVRYTDWKGWHINCGAINGLSTDADSDVHVKLYDTEVSDDVLGEAESTAVGLNATKLDLSDMKADRKKVYSAEITSIPKPQLAVFLRGEKDMVDSLKKQIEESEVLAAAFEWEQESSNGLKYEVEATADGFIVNQIQNQFLIQQLNGTQPAAVAYLVGLLNRIANWEHALHLHNPHSQSDPKSVEFCYSKFNMDGTQTDYHEDVTFNITKTHKGWSQIDGEIQARNTLDQKLHLMLVWFTEQFGVTVLYNGPHEQEDERFVFQLRVNDNIFERMGFCLSDDEGNRATHCLKLFVSNDQTDDFLLGQPPVEIGKTVTDFDDGGTRGAVFQKKLPRVTWFTKSINIHLVRQVSEIGATESELAEGKIKIKPHPSFQSSASLVPPCEPTRSDSGNDFVNGFRDFGFELVNFSSKRSSPESVLELDQITDRESLAENPLRMELEAPLEDDEYLIPVVFDGQSLSLAGDAWKDDSGKTHLNISELPEPMAEGRGILRPLKLYFFKAICGLEHVNKLSAYEISESGSISRTSAGLGEKVDKAERILVLVHGLYGDSYEMVKQVTSVVSAMDADEPPFDLILGYDYETINTPLEESARDLKVLLQSKGVAEGTDKQVTVVAHSMGGLVSRWFVEREQGNQMVSHLVLCGTPNEGTPFGTLALGVQAISNVVSLALDWLPAIVKSSAKAIQKSLKDRALTTTLAEISAQSGFMRKLNTSDDPKIPYTVIAGDVNEFVSAAGNDFVPGMLTRLGSTERFKSLFDYAKHDIAVSTDSARAVSDLRSPAPDKFELPCHHLNYFLSDAGIDCLKQIDWFPNQKGEQAAQ